MSYVALEVFDAYEVEIKFDTFKLFYVYKVEIKLNIFNTGCR